MSTGSLRLGTRSSLLARTQAELVASALRRSGVSVDLVPMISDGDRTAASLAGLGGTGVFATTLRRALAQHDCDAVVHSFKDLPTAPQPGLRIAAVPERADPRDALCGRLPLARLPRGARVGTGSPRRRAQLLAERGDLDVVDIRGNVDTRLRLVTDGDLAAVVLAVAGLDRIGRLDAASELLDWPTAPAQGALAVEIRTEDEATADLMVSLDHSPSHRAALAERAVLGAVEAGCAAPLAATATPSGDGLRLQAVAYRADGSAQQQVSQTSAGDPIELGRAVAAELLAAGIARWLSA
ncbi:MAG: hydroxymethylbilane synthase [Beutenbergiaceae bacterium]